MVRPSPGCNAASRSYARDVFTGYQHNCEKVLLPSIDTIFSQPSEQDDKDGVSAQTPVLYRIHYMNHCLHNVSTLDTETATALVRALELKADSLTRQMRVSHPEILLQIGVLETTISSLRGRLPAYDVFSAV